VLAARDLQRQASRFMLNDFVVRQAQLADADALFEAHQDSVLNLCTGAYSPEQMNAWFSGRSAEMYRPALEARKIWLAEQSNRVMGFVGFAPGEVTLLFVRQAAAGLGLGKQLFALGARKAGSDFAGPLTVVATMNSWKFYQSQGFVPVAEESCVRGEPEIHFPVIRMQRPLVCGS
jgi:GNAT superfamily N-acetyltransferase